MTTAQLAADRLDITAVLARHAYAADHQNETLLRDTVTVDARIATLLDPTALDPTALDPHSPGLDIDGLVALVGAPLTARTRETVFRTRETVFRNPLVAVNGDSATVVSELGYVELELLADGGAVRRQLDATAVDTLVRTSAGWLLAERRLHLADVDAAPVVVPEDRRPLIEQGAGILATAEYLGASPHGASTGGTEPASELLDVEAALAVAALERDRAAVSLDAHVLSSRHLVSNVKVVIDGDRAQAESEFVRTTLTSTADGVVRRRTSGVELTELQRSAVPDDGGWSVSSRDEYLKSDAHSPAEFDDAVRQSIVAGTRARHELAVPHPLALGALTDPRVAIRELLIRYSSVFDQERWPLVDEVFAPDAAFGDDTSGAGTNTFVAGAKALYHDRLTGLHSIAEPVLRIEGEHAWAYTDFTTIAIHEPADGNADHLDRLRSGGFYVDELHNTEGGWRVVRRDVAFSSSVRDTIDGGSTLRDEIARTRSRLGTPGAEERKNTP